MSTYDSDDHEDRTHELAQSIDWQPVRILTLDLGDLCGFAMGSYGHMVSGIWNLRPNRYDARLQTFKLVKNLEEFCKAYRPTRIVYHSSVRGNAGRKASKRADAILVAALEKWAADNRLPCHAANRGDVRKSFTGNGNASGETLIHQCERRNFMPLGEREAGAIATFHWALFDHIETVGAGQPTAIRR